MNIIDIFFLIKAYVYYLRKLLCMQIGKGVPLGKTCRANIELNWLYPASVWPTLRVGHKMPMNKKNSLEHY